MMVPLPVKREMLENEQCVMVNEASEGGAMREEDVRFRFANVQRMRTRSLILAMGVEVSEAYDDDDEPAIVMSSILNVPSYFAWIRGLRSVLVDRSI